MHIIRKYIEFVLFTLSQADELTTNEPQQMFFARALWDGSTPRFLADALSWEPIGTREPAFVFKYHRGKRSNQIRFVSFSTSARRSRGSAVS